MLSVVLAIRIAWPVLASETRVLTPETPEEGPARALGWFHRYLGPQA